MPTFRDVSGGVDFEATRLLVSSYLERDVQAIWVLGTGGEDMLVPFADRLELLRYLSANFGDQIRILAGISFFGLQESLNFLESIVDLNIDAVHYMPYYQLMGWNQIRENYLRLAAETHFPLWLYTSDNWTRPFPPDFLLPFVDDPRFPGCKFSTSNAVTLGQALGSDGQHFQIMSAVVKQLLPALVLGVEAYTTVEATLHLGRIQLIEAAFRRGDLIAARSYQRELNDHLMKLRSRAAEQNFMNIAEIKAIASRLGMGTGRTWPGLAEPTTAEVDDLVARYRESLDWRDMQEGGQR